VCWDDENEIGEQAWMGLEIESVEKVLWTMTGVGLLPKLTLLEAELESLIQLCREQRDGASGQER
jgi:hypothetical protein